MDLHRGGISECIEIRFRIIPIFTEFDSYPLYMFGIICMFFILWFEKEEGMVYVCVYVYNTLLLYQVY